MGMDVYGKKPVNETGEYFRRNVWGWRPLAEGLAELTPIWGRVKFPQSNDGSGLGPKQSVTLADQIDAALADGRIATWCAARDAQIAALPMEECRYCEGTGRRTDEVGVKMRMNRPGGIGCNGCQGVGKVEQWATNYEVEPNDFAEFSAFVRASGGFEIC